MSFERTVGDWRLRIGNIRACWNRNIERKYKLYRGYSGWVISCGRLMIGTF